MSLSELFVSFKQKLTTSQKSSLFFVLLFLLILPLSLAAILIPTQLKNRASEPITPPVISPSPIPTIAPILVCDPACYFQNNQCIARVTPKPGYNCQINPACSKDCTPEKIRERGNSYWCTAYCKRIIPTATPTPIISLTPTPTPSRQWCTMVGAIPLTPEGLRMRCCGGLTLCPPPLSQANTVRGYCKKFCYNTPVDWETPQVSLRADDFYIDVGGRGYHPGTNKTTVHSDLGNLTYTTLEVTWFENNIEMRLFIYFAADQNNWWISEIRTYNGENPGNWIIHQIANPNRIRLGQPMSIDGDLTAGVYFQGLHLKAFLCSLKSKGDANCDNKVDLKDFFIWRNEFLKYSVSIVPPTGGWKSDFNNDNKVDLKDFFIWRNGFLKVTPFAIVNCTNLYSFWTISSIIPSYIDGKVALKIKGNFPNSAYCLPRSYSFASMVNGTTGLVSNYWRSTIYTDYTSDSEISLKPFYSFTDGQYYFYLSMCQGSKGLNDDCSQFQLIQSRVTIQFKTTYLRYPQ